MSLETDLRRLGDRLAGLVDRYEKKARSSFATGDGSSWKSALHGLRDLFTQGISARDVRNLYDGEAFCGDASPSDDVTLMLVSFDPQPPLETNSGT